MRETKQGIVHVRKRNTNWFHHKCLSIYTNIILFLSFLSCMCLSVRWDMKENRNNASKLTLRVISLPSYFYLKSNFVSLRILLITVYEYGVK